MIAKHAKSKSEPNKSTVYNPLRVEKMVFIKKEQFCEQFPFTLDKKAMIEGLELDEQKEDFIEYSVKNEKGINEEKQSVKKEIKVKIDRIKDKRNKNIINVSKNQSNINKNNKSKETIRKKSEKAENIYDEDFGAWRSMENFRFQRKNNLEEKNVSEKEVVFLLENNLSMKSKSSKITSKTTKKSSSFTHSKTNSLNSNMNYIHLDSFLPKKKSKIESKTLPMNCKMTIDDIDVEIIKNDNLGKKKHKEKESKIFIFKKNSIFKEIVEISEVPSDSSRKSYFNDENANNSDISQNVEESFNVEKSQFENKIIRNYLHQNIEKRQQNELKNNNYENVENYLNSIDLKIMKKMNEDYFEGIFTENYDKNNPLKSERHINYYENEIILEKVIKIQRFFRKMLKHRSLSSYKKMFSKIVTVLSHSNFEEDSSENERYHYENLSGKSSENLIKLIKIEEKSDSVFSENESYNSKEFFNQNLDFVNFIEEKESFDIDGDLSQNHRIIGKEINKSEKVFKSEDEFFEGVIETNPFSPKIDSQDNDNENETNETNVDYIEIEGVNHKIQIKSVNRTEQCNNLCKNNENEKYENEIDAPISFQLDVVQNRRKERSESHENSMNIDNSCYVNKDIQSYFKKESFQNISEEDNKIEDCPLLKVNRENYLMMDETLTDERSEKIEKITKQISIDLVCEHIVELTKMRKINKEKELLNFEALWPLYQKFYFEVLSERICLSQNYCQIFLKEIEEDFGFEFIHKTIKEHERESFELKSNENMFITKTLNYERSIIPLSAHTETCELVSRILMYEFNSQNCEFISDIYQNENIDFYEVSNEFSNFLESAKVFHLCIFNFLNESLQIQKAHLQDYSLMKNTFGFGKIKNIKNILENVLQLAEIVAEINNFRMEEEYFHHNFGYNLKCHQEKTSIELINENFLHFLCEKYENFFHEVQINVLRVSIVYDIVYFIEELLIQEFCSLFPKYLF